MKCGSCKEDHETVAQVKLCYHRKGQAPQPQRPEPWEKGAKSAPQRREDSRQTIFQQIRKLGDRLEEGGYAIRNSGRGENDIIFYDVEKPDTGLWAGGTFVHRRASDERIKLSAKETLRVLTAIVADPQGASLLFGSKLGICGVCNRTLTTKESRDRGIGPKCAKRMGWSDVA